MLHRVRVKGFKSLRDVEVRLRPLVVLLGPNTAGKSNFLESLLLLARVVTERTLADALGPPIRGYPVEAFDASEGGLRGLLSRDFAELVLEADLRPAPDGTSQGGDPLRYRVGIRIQPKTGALSVCDEYLARLGRGGEPKQKPRIERDDSPSPPRLVIRRLGEAGHPQYAELGLGHTIASNLQFSGETRYPDFDRLRHELASWRTYYLDPRVSMREPQPPREVTDIGPLGEMIAPFLYRLQVHPDHGRLFSAVERAVRAAIPSIDKMNVLLDETRGTLDIEVVQDGIPYSSRVLSEGTLRVLALCALAANPWHSSLIGFEEPENGVHPRRIEVIAKLLVSLLKRPRRQVIVTTHSSHLLGCLASLVWSGELDDHQVAFLRCTQSAGLTRIEPLDVGPPLFLDREIHEALKAREDEQVIHEMLLRGWLDG